MTSRRPPYVAVVRPGERELFRMLKDYLEARGLVEVVWDRRVGDRRGPADRRKAHRGDAPETRRRAERRERLPRERAEQLGFFIARRRP